MTWREDLRRVTLGNKVLVGASFRGVPFLVESVERSGGRRAVVHEFPLRDEPFAEDLGRKARTFRIEGYVLGDDYLVQLDALLVALEDKSGPGALKHPYKGELSAMCTGLNVRQSRADGGIAMLALEFAETPAQAPTPAIVADAPGKVAAAATRAIVASRGELLERFGVAGMPAFALASASGALSKATAGVGKLLAPAITSAQELAVLTGKVAVVTAQASSLIRAPGDAFDALHGAITGLTGAIAAAPRAVVGALADAYGIDLGAAVAPLTATRAREAANQTALVGALRQVFAIEAARLTPTVPFESIDDASAVRDRVAAMLDEQARGAGDTAYPGLVTLRAELLRAVPGVDLFTRIVTVHRSTATPSLLLAYQLYGSVKLEADILARNRIRNPAFVAGDLQVLSDG